MTKPNIRRQMRISKSHSAGKFKLYLRFFNNHSVAKNQKKMKGPFGDIKNSRKKSQCRKKIEMGDALISSGFVCHVKKVKIKGGHFVIT